MWPGALHAQQATVPVIGFLSARSPKESEPLVSAFRRGLIEGGLSDGRSVSVEYRWADNQYNRLPALATELVRQRVSLLVAVGGDMTAEAAIATTKSIPIVAVFIGDPVASGYVASLNRPGGNITGVSNLNAVIESKRLSLLREIRPGATVIGALLNPTSPTSSAQQKDIEEAARSVGLQVEFWKASSEAEFETVFQLIAKKRIPGLLIPADALFASARGKLASLSTQHGVPAIHSIRDAAVAGALMSYGVDLFDTYRLIGVYAARIVLGEKPSELPVVQPTKFQFVINMKTAKALSLTIPSGILAIADEVIE